MIPAKICGITRSDDARLAVELGAAALGFIFYHRSQRYIQPAEAKAIADSIGKPCRKVGVFVNAPPEEVNSIVTETGLDMVQLSGDESPENCSRVAVPVIKTIHIGEDFHPSIVETYKVHAFLLDTYRTGSFGGTGEPFQWKLVDRDWFPQPVILSGGLNPDNILRGIDAINPHAVDINSGIETAPGVKDPQKMERLFAILHQTRASDEQIF